MTWHLHRRTADELNELLVACKADQLTDGPSGGSLGAVTPAGLRRREWRCELTGADAFDRGSEAIRAWSLHRGAGLDVACDGPIVVETNVALCAPLPIGFVDATCRIVAVVQEATRFGFAYGTLSVHPEQGEESFVVRREADGTVLFEVVAVSRAVHPMARACPPVAARLQDAAASRYLTAMRDVAARSRDDARVTSAEHLQATPNEV